MKKIQALIFVFALFIANSVFAFPDFVKIVNKTGTHLNVEYSKYTDNQRNEERGAFNIFKDITTFFKLRDTQTIIVWDAKEIDYTTGNDVPNGAKGHFTHCNARASKTITFYLAAPGVIDCRVDR
jgi:hypothetical protein